jgi:hypothetical protein
MRSKLVSSAFLFASVLLLLCLLSANCAHSVSVRTDAESVPALQYGQPRELSQLEDARINESSGIAASIRYKDSFWTHNDSGDSARLFLIDKEGKTLAVVNIKGVTAVDWEDIASFRLGGEDYVLIADMGDNARKRDRYVLYIVREPAISIHSTEKEAPVVEVEPDSRIRFRYENGPLDSEAVAVDPAESTIYLVSKDVEECTVYSMPIPPSESGEPYIAKPVAQLKVSYANGMDISPDGKRAIVLTYGDAYEYSRGESESWTRAFSREPRLIKAPVRKQGESICYGPDGKTLYLTSEEEHQPLWEIPVIENPK